MSLAMDLSHTFWTFNSLLCFVCCMFVLHSVFDHTFLSLLLDCFAFPFLSLSVSTQHLMNALYSAQIEMAQAMSDAVTHLEASLQPLLTTHRLALRQALAHTTTHSHQN